MIQVMLYGNKGFDVSGHAGYAEVGHDIVCAAISVLSQSITEYLGVKMSRSFVIRDNTTGLTIIKNATLSIEDSILANGMFEMFKKAVIDIEKQYPDYVKVIEANA